MPVPVSILLTGLANRRAFDDAVVDEVLLAMGENRPMVICIVDLDHFKAVNDDHGHEAGDMVLVDVASLLKEGE